MVRRLQRECPSQGAKNAIASAVQATARGKTNRLSGPVLTGQLQVDIKLGTSKEIQSKLDETGLELLEYENRYKCYRMRLSKDDAEHHKSLLTDLFKLANEAK